MIFIDVSYSVILLSLYKENFVQIHIRHESLIIDLNNSE